MKNIILLTVLLSAIVLSGCSNAQNTQNPDNTQKPQQEKPIVTDVKPVQDAPVAQPNIVWKSQPKGDFAYDDRNPADVCKQIQTEQKMDNCTLIDSISSNSDKECVDGKSVAGCFACKFSCS